MAHDGIRFGPLGRPARTLVSCEFEGCYLVENVHFGFAVLYMDPATSTEHRAKAHGFRMPLYPYEVFMTSTCLALPLANGKST